MKEAYLERIKEFEPDDSTFTKNRFVMRKYLRHLFMGFNRSAL